MHHGGGRAMELEVPANPINPYSTGLASIQMWLMSPACTTEHHSGNIRLQNLHTCVFYFSRTYEHRVFFSCEAGNIKKLGCAGSVASGIQVAWGPINLRRRKIQRRLIFFTSVPFGTSNLFYKFEGVGAFQGLLIRLKGIRMFQEARRSRRANGNYHAGILFTLTLWSIYGNGKQLFTAAKNN